MTIVTIGIVLAKNVFAVHGVDATGKPVLIRPSAPRSKILGMIPTTCTVVSYWPRIPVRLSGVAPSSLMHRTKSPARLLTSVFLICAFVLLNRLSKISQCIE